MPVGIFVVRAGRRRSSTKTADGRYAQAIGSATRPSPADAAVDVDRIKIRHLHAAGICVGVATLLYVLRARPASPTTGLLWELEAIASVIVGGAALKGGQGSIAGTVVGAILLSVISNILNLTSIISVYLNAAVQGFVIITVALLQGPRLASRGRGEERFTDQQAPHSEVGRRRTSRPWRFCPCLRLMTVHLGVSILRLPPTASWRHQLLGQRGRRRIQAQGKRPEDHHQDGLRNATEQANQLQDLSTVNKINVLVASV